MDITKIYINQCEKAVKIQESRFHLLRGDMACIDISKNPFLCEQSGNRDNLIWLPRQDDLQEMLKDKFKLRGGMDLYHLVKCFQVFQVKYTAGLGLTSMEQLWLAFVMLERFNKTWNGNDWEEIK